MGLWISNIQRPPKDDRPAPVILINMYNNKIKIKREGKLVKTRKGIISNAQGIHRLHQRYGGLLQKAPAFHPESDGHLCGVLRCSDGILQVVS